MSAASTAAAIRSAARLDAPQSLFDETAASIARAQATYPVRLFRAMAAGVPTYRDFLRRNKIAPGRIRTVADLRLVPPISRVNYLTQYPFEKLCWGGTLSGKGLTYTSTSGSTGQPFYFPRDTALDRRSSLLFELYLRTLWRGRPVPTLYIVSFGMGVWIGGIISYQSCRLLGERGLPISVITPGGNKPEVWNALLKLAPKYGRVVLGGYPPFVKDLLDEAGKMGFDPTRRPLNLMFAAETFNETFRDYVADKAGIGDVCRETASIYGNADIGSMAIRPA